MAFLCPVRIKRNKKKKHDEDSLRGGPSMGRITGSASIETLVRVGIEKEAGLSAESKMVVLHDFSPCVDDELQVKRGQIVHVLYQENDWVYVISDTSKEGFIPHSYTAQFGSQLADLALKVKKKMNRDPGVEDQVGGHGPGQSPGHPGHQAPGHKGSGVQANNERNNNDGKVNTGLDFSDSDSLQDMRKDVGNPGMTNQSRTSSLLSESSSQPEVHPFYKDAYGGYIVLYSYSAQDENDLSVERGQCVTVLNKDDPEWFWVVKSDGEEGFVPAGFIYPLDAIQKQQTMSAGFFQGVPQGPPATTNPNHQQSMNQHGSGLPATTNTASLNDANIGRTFLATPTLASPVAQQFTQLSISPQQISSGPMSNISMISAPLSSLSAPLSSLSAPLSSISGGQTSLPGIINQSMSHATSPDIISSTTVGGGGGGFNGNSHLGGQQQVPGTEQHQHQLNSLGSTVSGIRSTSGAGSTAGTSSGPNSLNPGTIGLPPPPNSGSGGRHQTDTGSGQQQGAPGGGQHQGGVNQAAAGPAGDTRYQAAVGPAGDTRYGGTELVMLYDYKAQAPDDLSVRRGDWIYADLQNQTVDGWLWAYAPKTRKYGFIPKAYARPPAMTNL